LIDKAFLRDLIANPDEISTLEYHNILQIIHQAVNIFNEETLLLELNVEELDREVFVIGDIHGNLRCLQRLVEIIEQTNPRFVIFLGDIVDRGPYQLECLIMVLALKIRYPNKYYILKGNHETLEMNQYYGFYNVLMSKFYGQMKFDEILSLYLALPFCALVNNSILCLHGGIPEDIEFIRKLKGLKPKDIALTFKSIAKILMQIMWNDPKSGLKGFSESFRGPGIRFFGEDVFDDFMKENNLKYLIRSHEVFPEGYRWFFSKRLLSIFSSDNYRATNPASYAIIKKDLVQAKLVD
jgi:diadenosine tetraphosphatase ApaH/serine/threonine PP2A family protein phosphatase